MDAPVIGSLNGVSAEGGYGSSYYYRYARQDAELAPSFERPARRAPGQPGPQPLEAGEGQDEGGPVVEPGSR